MNFQESYPIIEEESYPQLTAATRRLLEFIKTRRKGAEKIHTQSTRRSGTARLTAKHFGAKLPVYDRVIKLVEKDKELLPLKKEYLSLLSQLRRNRQPMKFQELTGKLEALGEILIETGNM
jgi:hypothetical protein